MTEAGQPGQKAAVPGGPKYPDQDGVRYLWCQGIDQGRQSGVIRGRENRGKPFLPEGAVTGLPQAQRNRLSTGLLLDRRMPVRPGSRRNVTAPAQGTGGPDLGGEGLGEMRGAPQVTVVGCQPPGNLSMAVLVNQTGLHLLQLARP